MPSTGNILTLKLGSAPRSPTEPFLYSSSGSGSSSALPSPVLSTEYTTGTPDVTPCSLSLLRVDRDSGSSVVAEMSPTIIRVGSLLHPDPAEEMTGRPLSWQYLRSATLVSMLSMASMTKSGLRPSSPHGESISSATSISNFSWRISNFTHGVTAIIRRYMHCTLGMPTSASVATECRFSELSVTWSKSIKRMRDTPERASAETQCDPTPPRPTTTTKELRSLARPSSVRKTRLRASCSRMSSSSKSPACALRARASLRRSSLSTKREAASPFTCAV